MDVRQRRYLALMLAPYALGLGALIVVPALVWTVGERIWWPAKAAG